MLAFALPAALGCLILLLFLAEKCLKLERFQVSLSRSRFAQSAAQRANMWAMREDVLTAMMVHGKWVMNDISFQVADLPAAIADLDAASFSLRRTRRARRASRR